METLQYPHHLILLSQLFDKEAENFFLLLEFRELLYKEFDYSFLLVSVQCRLP